MFNMEDYFSGLCIGDWILVSNLSQGPKCKYDESDFAPISFKMDKEEEGRELIS